MALFWGASTLRGEGEGDYTHYKMWQAALIIQVLPHLLALLCCLAVPESFQAHPVVGLCHQDQAV